MRVRKIPRYAIGASIGICAADKPHDVASASQALRNSYSLGRNFNCLATPNAEASAEFIFYSNIFPLAVVSSDKHIRFVVGKLSCDVGRNVHLPDIIRAILKGVRKSPQAVNLYQRISWLCSRPRCRSRGYE